MTQPTSEVIYQGSLHTQCTHLQSNNQIITDAPTDNQGKGEAFSPTDLLSTSLASCMLTIMGIVAKNHDLPFGEAKTTMTKIMAENPRRVSEIQIDIVMPDEDFTPEQKKLLEQAALNCPVAKSLSADIQQTVQFHYVASNL